MANGGWYGTSEEWIAFEAPLLAIDPSVERFAGRHGLTIMRNHKDWPSRHLSWRTSNGVAASIQLWLDEGGVPELTLWAVASQDRQAARYWREQKLIASQPVTKVLADLPALLEEAHALVLEWAREPEKLEFATTIARLD